MITFFLWSYSAFLLFFMIVIGCHIFWVLLWSFLCLVIVFMIVVGWYRFWVLYFYIVLMIVLGFCRFSVFILTFFLPLYRFYDCCTIYYRLLQIMALVVYESLIYYCCRLCVIGLAATHIALNEPGGVTSVDFNVGKSDRSEMKATGKRKRVSYFLVLIYFLERFWLMCGHYWSHKLWDSFHW